MPCLTGRIVFEAAVVIVGVGVIHRDRIIVHLNQLTRHKRTGHIAKTIEN